jgi:hypothetical protein
MKDLTLRLQPRWCIDQSSVRSLRIILNSKPSSGACSFPAAMDSYFLRHVNSMLPTSCADFMYQGPKILDWWGRAIFHYNLVLTTLQTRLEVALANSGHLGITFSSLLTDFLKGSGIPIPDSELFADVQEHFNSIINLDDIDDGGFRARMFCWATTGSCERASDASCISVNSLLYYACRHSF